MNDPTPILESFMNKAQINNFLTSPVTSESNKEIKYQKIQPVFPPQRNAFYSPEIEELRNEIFQVIQSQMQSYASEIDQIKQDSSQYKFDVFELKRDFNILGTSIVEYQKETAREISEIKTEIQETVKNEPKGADTFKNVKKLHDLSNEMNTFNDKYTEITRQIYNINREIEELGNQNFIPKEVFKKNMNDIIDELERKLNILNENFREQIHVLNLNFTSELKQHEDEITKLAYGYKSLHTQISSVSSNLTPQKQDVNVESMVESELRKHMNMHINEIRNLSNLADSAEKRLRSAKKEETMVLSQSMMATNREYELKIRELDNIAQNLNLLEKDLKSKSDMYELNLTTVKRNLELELALEIKRMILPIQKNMEEYLKNNDTRIAVVEDALLNAFKKETLMMPVHEQTRSRVSEFIAETNQMITKSAFQNSSQSGLQFKESATNWKAGTVSGVGSGGGMSEVLSVEGEKQQHYFAKERNTSKKEEPYYKIEQLDSVVSINDEDNYTSENRESYIERPASNRDSYVEKPRHETPVTRTEKPKVHFEEPQEEPEENEQPLHTMAQSVKPDQDHQRQVADPKRSQRNFSPSRKADPDFKDFPSSSALKSHMQLEYSSRKIKETYQSNSPDSANNRGLSKESKSSPQKEREDKKQTSVNNNSGKNKQQQNDRKLLLSNEVFTPDDEPQPLIDNKFSPVRNQYDRNIEDDFVEDEEEEFHGNIKGLLKKSKKREQQQSPPKDNTRNNKSPYSNRNDPSNQASSHMRKNPLLSNPLDKPRSKELPPVDTKSVKNFNKKPLQQKAAQQDQYFMKQEFYGNQNPYGKNGYWDGNQQTVEEDDVEEIVYHVNEEGFLVDEHGNLLVDENGNYLKLSPDQMRELQDNDLIYERDY